MQDELHISAENNGLICIGEGGRRSFVGWDEIESIEISTLDAFTTEVDYISISCAGGALFEVDDRCSGFEIVAAALSARFGIDPPIRHRFASLGSGSERVFARHESEQG